MSFVKLLCEHTRNPLGIGEQHPCLSWVVSSRHPVQMQAAYQLQVWPEGSSPEGEGSWDSGKVQSAENLNQPVGLELKSETRYFWRVRVYGEDGAETPWSPRRWFETAFMKPGEWKPSYIGRRRKDTEDRRATYFRQTLKVKGGVARARVAITALGVYQLEVNGQKVSDDWLVPGWTNYHKRNQYLIYDIGPMLKEGTNCIGIILGDGWYSGHLLFGHDRNLYGTTPAVAARISIQETDGSARILETGPDWRMSTGPLLLSDIYDGETYDARREKAGWSLPDYSPRGWRPAEAVDADPGVLEAKICPPVRTREVLHPQVYWQQDENTWTYDFNQNMVGTVRIRLPKARRGHKVTLRFAEMVEDDGSLFNNVRNARCIDEYIYSGDEPEEFLYEPLFTYHGFTYVEVIDYPGVPAGDILEGRVLATDIPESGSFRCSNRELNRLSLNILWGQRGNFVEIPTDCPQRDERMGWTGDAQVILPAGCYYMDLYPFYRKWLRDLRDDQNENGAFPDVAPDILSSYNQAAFKDKPRYGTAGWGDAGAICPWVLYERYGDVRILEENYEAVLRWVRFCEDSTTGLIRPDTNYGDWLDPLSVRPMDAQTPNQLVGTAYFARSTELAARMADVLGRKQDARRLWGLWRRIRKAFAREFITPSGRLVGDTQTGYTLALGFNLLEDPLIPKAVERLAYLFERRNYKISTGFLGASLVCDVLSRFGRTDVAYEAVLQREYPGWLFTVRNGATTMWECWNSWTPEGGFRDPEMNSFNHYAYGAVGNWMFQNIGGIMPDADAPAFKRFTLKPEMHDSLSWARASFDSPRGRIESSWKRTARGCRFIFQVPPNTEAKVVLPAPSKRGKLRVNGKALETSVENGAWTFALGPGKYEVTAV